ncbi:hypothetical protein ACEWY4_024621 [Coilia grayii]|uniref:Ig-like domain-containing protein n=1 Tax=Coilia grayii TaxID=363190 RepID=A0ABD1IV84_9TELE
MARTFQFRRQEIVDQKPTIENLMERWPALFQMEEIYGPAGQVLPAAGQVLPQLDKYSPQLDKYSPQLLKIIRKKGGTTKAKTATILELLDQDADADVRRECVLKALIIYLGERVEDLIKEYTMSQKDQAKQELESTVMVVFVFRENSSPLQQPQDIGFTFEALQKILLELGSNKMTSKIRKLKGVLMAVFSMSLSTSVVVREGQSVQLKCSVVVKDVQFISVTWLRQSDQSAPVSILTIANIDDDSRTTRHENNTEHMTGTIDISTRTSTLKISSVSVSDAGLYYCGTQPGNHMIYYNATYLNITGVLMAVFSQSKSTSVVVREGQSAQMNCSVIEDYERFISVTWLRQTDQSAPVSILTTSRRLNMDGTQYHNSFSCKHMTESTTSSTSTLEIRSVSVSDAGLYYCGTQPGKHMIYYNATYLNITAPEPVSESPDTADNGELCSGVCVIVVLVLGLLSAVLNLVLLILFLTKHRGPVSQTSLPPDQGSDSVNYATLSFSAKKKRRNNFQTDNPHVIYAATR